MNHEKYKIKTEKKLRKLAHVFKTSLEAGSRQRPYLKQAMLFRAWQTRIIISKDKSPADYQFWATNGWLERDYFYQTKIGIFPKLLFRLLKKRIKKLMTEAFIY